MRALVTGSAGFVGGHMLAELESRGWDVFEADIKDGLDCLDVFRTDTFRYDLVVHAAASSPHRAAIDREPVHMARNLMLDAAMFDWAVRTGQGRVVYLSSSAAYPVELQSSGPCRLHEFHAEPDGSGAFIRDDGHGMTPDGPYGWTKLTGEYLAGQARAAGLPVTVVRPFSGYGADQADLFPFRALIERARRREDPFTIWGDGQQVRDWIHIYDVIDGILAVVESGTTDPVNICTGVGTSMVDLARMACEVVGYEPEFEFRLDAPAGVAYRVGDPSRFHQYYKPQISLREGIERALGA